MRGRWRAACGRAPPSDTGCRKSFSMPACIREKTFRAWRPIRLIARADRGYRLKENCTWPSSRRGACRRVLVRRDRAIGPELAVEKITGERVSDIGYVLTRIYWAASVGTQSATITKSGCHRGGETTRSHSQGPHVQGTPVHKDSAMTAPTARSANRSCAIASSLPCAVIAFQNTGSKTAACFQRRRLPCSDAVNGRFLH